MIGPPDCRAVIGKITNYLKVRDARLVIANKHHGL